MSSRRAFLHAALASGVAMRSSRAAELQIARVAITLDLEMSRNFPTWETTHWDYEKGSLDEATKRYALAVAKLAREAGAKMHFFLVGRALEQEDVEWLKEIIEMGHAIGNHTYDHVFLLATKPEETQFRFHRAPWLVEGKSVEEILRENIRLTTRAMKTRLGVEPNGFRAPGGFPDGLALHPKIQRMLLDEGFGWVSAKYPNHKQGGFSREILDDVIQAQAAAQPFRYPSGLWEVPMSPISDVGAFRTGRWKLDDFLQAIDAALDWTLRERAVFDFLGHPSVLTVMDPEARAVKRILHRVKEAGEAAKFVTLDELIEGRSP